MSKICTSIEQSQKLIELGIDVNTADMRYGYIAPYEYSDRMFDGGYDEVPYPKDFLKRNPNFSENEYDSELPAWSISALFNILPKGVSLLKNSYDETYTIINTDFENEDVKIEWYNEPIDAAFEAVVRLKENRKL